MKYKHLHSFLMAEGSGVEPERPHFKRFGGLANRCHCQLLAHPSEEKYWRKLSDSNGRDFLGSACFQDKWVKPLPQTSEFGRWCWNRTNQNPAYETGEITTSLTSEVN